MRLFIAVNFDENALAEIDSYQKDLKDCKIEGNYTPRENLHLTLAFIGEYSDPDEILDIMESIPFGEFSLKIEKIELFRDMYLARMTDHPMLQSYVRRLRRALSDAGIPFDKKKFRPHITLVRRAQYPEDAPVIEWEGADYEISVDSISLMRSQRGRNGMIYTELGSVYADEFLTKKES